MYIFLQCSLSNDKWIGSSAKKKNEQVWIWLELKKKVVPFSLSFRTKYVIRHIYVCVVYRLLPHRSLSWHFLTCPYPLISFRTLGCRTWRMGCGSQKKIEFSGKKRIQFQFGWQGDGSSGGDAICAGFIKIASHASSFRLLLPMRMTTTIFIFIVITRLLFANVPASSFHASSYRAIPVHIFLPAVTVACHDSMPMFDSHCCWPDKKVTCLTHYFVYNLHHKHTQLISAEWQTKCYWHRKSKNARFKFLALLLLLFGLYLWYSRTPRSAMNVFLRTSFQMQNRKWF